MILGKYNQSKTITFDLVAPDGIDLIINATFATGDLKIMKDEGAEANTTNLPTDEGTGYSLVLTATEMSAARIRVYVIDQTGTKIWLDVSLGVETYGHASAEHAFDLDTAAETMRGTDNAATATNLATVDTNVDSILVDTGTTIPGTITTVQNDLDIITDTDGVVLGAAGVDLIWDEVLTGATHNVTSSAGRRLRQVEADYIGSIWIDTVNGTAGAVDYTNGLPDNPVNNIADANTLAASLGFSRFIVTPGSSITFAASQTSQKFEGVGWTAALGGQDFSNTEITGASVSGIATSPTGDIQLRDCDINTTTLGTAHLHKCILHTTLTLSAAGNYLLLGCMSGVAGSNTPAIDFGAAVGNTNLNMRHYSGGIQIDNKDTTGTDNMSLEGNGQLSVAASSGGNISVRGNFKVTNTGGATISYDDTTSEVSELQVAHTNGNLGSNVDKVNGVTITGDGSGTPFNV